ncbi:MAG: UDP-N-acetylmuramoyl-tripeptide--D-alanyl-D-alanine ligase, partial [Candidatus Omnitrophica bacterium]|nr:UDP-N-acetylmuramoyl-tripeptide--D-alanyl-D-alanine ligase [Candidatus Omnitrophota bacterium]
MLAKEILKITRGKLISGSADTRIDPSRISTDSRTISKGGLFIALKGDNFDGNDFADEVLRKGACGAVVSVSGLRSAVSGKVIIRVKDTTRALQEIAAYHRGKFRIPVVCVTGSNGKTTVKDMIWHLLSGKYDVLRNEGTKNNHIGVPQTLLKLNSEHDICVLELGTNHKGEIALLAGIARPTIAVFTNIGPSHLEFLGGLEGVFEAKKELLRYLDRKSGLVILNGDDRFLSKIRGGKFKAVRYGFNDPNDLRAETFGSGSGKNIFVVNNRMIFELGLFGRHNIYNALAAIAVTLNFGISHKEIRERLLSYKGAGMRLELHKVRGIDILNDSYNSNPLSMTQALEVVRYYPARARWVVTGDMLELGRDSERFHRMVGESVAKSGIEGLVTFGELSKHTLSQARSGGMRQDRLWHCSTHDEIAELLRKVARRGDV